MARDLYEEAGVVPTAATQARDLYKEAGLAPTRSDSYSEGTKANDKLRDFISVLQGPTFGFGDEIGGGVVGGVKGLFNGKPFAQNYQETRDFMRGAADQQKAEHPIKSVVDQILPTMALGGGLPAVFKGTGFLNQLGNAAITGGVTGAINGLGSSSAPDLAGNVKDSGWNAVVGATVPFGVLPLVRGVSGAVSNGAQRFSESSAMQAAKQKIAEAFLRDSTAPGVSDPMGAAAARIGKLGDEARVTDAGGASIRALHDTLATLPGQTKQATEVAIKARQAGRGERLITAADDALGTSGQRVAPTIEALIQQRSQTSAPLYDQLHKLDIPADQTLGSIVQSANLLGATKLGREIAAGNQRQFTLPEDVVNRSGTYSMADLDYLKQSLDTLIAKKGTDSMTGRLTPLGVSYQKLRDSLTSHLDGVTNGFYAQARQAFAGPSAVMDAAAAGRRILSKDDSTIKTTVAGMSPSELDGFKIGAFDALRSKLGTQGGQTQLMNMWREPGTQEKLKAIFGDERSYREFAASVAAEARMKGIEQVGRGSQTAARQYGAGDLDAEAVKAGAGALASVKTGDPVGAVAGAKAAWNRVAMPEPTRDAMGRILLSQGRAGQAGLLDIRDIANQVATERQRQAAQLGLLGMPFGGQ